MGKLVQASSIDIYFVIVEGDRRLESIRRIAGHHSQEIDAILGYEYGPVAVHRDDMITR